MLLALIAAATTTGVIGNRGMLPWRRQPADMAHFKQVTMGSPVVMGRTTFESLPEAFRPLPGRPNIVMTRQEDYAAPEGVTVLHNAGAVMEHLAKKHPDATAYVIGGGEIYHEFLPQADLIYLTEVEADLPGDTWFPVLDPAEWRITAEENHPADDNNEFAMIFRTYERRR